MKNYLITILFLFFFIIVRSQQPGPAAVQFRPPSVPLVTHDPYFSIWSPADRLTDRETVHWTGARNPLHSMVRVDGRTYRLMGSEPGYVEPMTQVGLSITPTSTLYEFACSTVKLTMIFTSPLLVKNPDIMSRPVTYITWEIVSADGKQHEIQVYSDLGSEVAVNTTNQQVLWEVTDIKGLKSARIGSRDQVCLNKSGDDVRIDWGFAYICTKDDLKASVTTGNREDLLDGFARKGSLPGPLECKQARAVKEGYVSAAIAWDCGKTGNAPSKVWQMLAYDDIFSIRYFKDDLVAWWRRNGMSFNSMLQQAEADYPAITDACRTFDHDLMKDLESAGGPEYSKMCALAYRQCIAAHKLVADKNGSLLFFPKENFSNGCIATVDVIYPFSPFALLFSPDLTRAMLRPVLDYASSPSWKFPFAPHDLGTYPYATGQVYGGGEKDITDQMPVEETGNMLIMLAALAKAEGNAGFAKQYWPLVEKWADYLLSKGFNPENQLCTDDFAGHLAHNVNLSAKAIVAIASYSMLCDMTGEKDRAAEVRKKAEGMAADWVRLATEGDHTLLAYDQPGTWSQKYNLVWDKLLGLNLFPRETFRRETEFYKKVQAQFGVPLDNRERYSKNDWITWSATLADNKDDFITLFKPVWQFAQNTPDRIPVSDWYIVDNAIHVGFQARSVVGGFFIKMLDSPDLWKKWSGKQVK
ncbi:MAG TPA: DUF4965 domain-containing protein [Bacteroidales bacterium]|nr:DUF4965 domain-containing protein [Bacteroidales bacterium]